MITVDTHCDTVTKLMETGGNLYENSCHIDLKRLENKKHVQFFAAFIEPVFCQAYALKRAVEIIDRFFAEVESYKDKISFCAGYGDIVKTLNSNKIAAVLSIEGGEALQGQLASLRIFYRLGVRSICLTWNNRNEIADGAAFSETRGGLTPFGKSVVEEMNKLGMLVDLSHISENGFWDVIDIAKQPVIVSHSNARSLCGHRRNLSDKQIEAVKVNGGVIGINFYPNFLNDSGEASLKDVIKHIEYICALAGDKNLGIGADFDGIEKTPADLKGIQDVDSVFNELLKLNYSEGTVQNIAGLNFMRVIKQVIG